MSRSEVPCALRGRRLRGFAGLVANGLGQAATSIATALLVERGFDTVLGNGPAPMPALGPLAAWLGLATGLVSWLRAAERVGAERVGQDYTHELRLLLFDHLAITSPRLLQQRSQGGVVLRFVGDLTAMRQWVSLGLARLIVAGTMTAGTLGLLGVLDPALAGVIAAILAVGVTGVLAEGSALRRRARQARRHRSRLAGNVTEKVAAIGVVQAFGQIRRERRRVERQSRQLAKAMVARARSAGRIRGVTEGTAATATAGVLLVGAAAGRDPGSVAAGMTVVGLLASHLRDLGRVQERWHEACVARAKITEFLARPTQVSDWPDAPPLHAGPGRLMLRNVHLGSVLHGINAVAEPGQVVAIVGPNGAGKSTLLAVVARLVNPDAGQVLLDGQDLAWHQLASVRRSIGLVGPDLPLLRGSVGRNLRYRWPDAPPEKLARAWALTRLDEVLEELPEGERTRVAEGGVGLSSGQRQCIMLARALLGDPPLLLLDEVDANLDARATAVVDRVLAQYRGTVLIVTHRRDRLACADVVWHLAEGRLVEVGPPAALLTAGGPTAQLFCHPSRHRPRGSNLPRGG